MPFIKGRSCTELPSGGSALLDCRLAAINYPVEFYSEGAAQEISRILHEELKDRYGPAVKDYGAGAAVFQKLKRDQPTSTPRDLASDFAREIGVEYVMAGVLDNYIERKGGAGGIERPASVGFSIYLLHAPTGSVVFEGSFNETQQSLSENVLAAGTFFRRGARWVTAAQLAREGINDILEEIQ
jgi:hypothetical protein